MSFNFCVTHPPPGTPLGQNENEDAVPRVGILFFVQFPERGKILQWWPPPSWGGMGNAKIEWHIREKNFSKFPFRPIRIKMLVSKFWFLTNFYLVNFSQLNQKCGIVSSSSNSVVLIRKKNFQKFPLRPIRENLCFLELFSWKWPFTPSNLRRIFKERVGFEPSVRLIILLQSVQGTCNNLKSDNGMRR